MKHGIINYVIVGNGRKWKEKQENIKSWPNFYKRFYLNVQYILCLFLSHNLDCSKYGDKEDGMFYVFIGEYVRFSEDKKEIDGIEGILCQRCNRIIKNNSQMVADLSIIDKKVL